jgi:hypothetical protein
MAAMFAQIPEAQRAQMAAQMGMTPQQFTQFTQMMAQMTPEQMDQMMGMVGVSLSTIFLLNIFKFVNFCVLQRVCRVYLEVLGAMVTHLMGLM